MKIISVVILTLGFLLGAGLVSAQNNALEFDGAGDYVQVASPGASFVSGDFTVELWLNADTWESPGWNSLVSSRTGITYNWQFIYIYGKLSVWVSGGANQIYFDGITPSINKWHHLALVRNGTLWMLYLDGVLVSQQTDATVVTTADYNLNIGASGGTDGYFDGEMDEIRIWDDARTQAEIRANMYRELPNPYVESDLVAYYKLNESSGTSAADTKGSYNGTLYNMAGTEWIASPAFFGPKTCVSFDGVDDKIALSNLNVSTTSGDKTTVEFWMYWDGNSGDFPFSFAAYDLWLYNSSFGFNTFNSDLYGISSSGLSNKWVHVAAIFNNGDVTQNVLYIDGIEQSLSQLIGTPSGTEVVSATATIGGHATDIYNYFTGEIDELRIWNGSRTANEIRENMCRTLTGNETNLLAYYNMDFGRGTEVPDFSANGDDGHAAHYYSGSVSSIESPQAFNDLSASWTPDALIGKLLYVTTTGSEQVRTIDDNFDQTLHVSVAFSPSLVPGDTYYIRGDDLTYEASSAFNTWLNTGNSSWATATNWSRGTAPGSTDNIGVYSYSGGTTAAVSGTPSLKNLLLGASSDMTVSSGFTITGNLMLEDNLDVNGQTITLGSAAKLYEGTGRLTGTSGSITTTRTLSNLNEDVAGLGALIQTNANLGSTTITRTFAPSSNPTGIYRGYQISPTNNTGLNASLVFNYDDSELNGLTEADLTLYESANGTTWVELGGILNTTNNTLTVEGLNAFPHYITASDYYSYSDNKYISTSKAVNCANSSVYQTNDFTVEFMIRLDVANTYLIPLIDYGDNFEIQKMGEAGYDGIKFQMGGIFISATLANTSGGNMGKWHHVACTYNSTSDAMKLYVDGVLIETKTNNSYTPSQDNLYLYHADLLGQVSMDEVRYWNYERSEAEVQENMYKVTRGNDARLLLYLRFDQTPLIDNSSYGLTITSSTTPSLFNSDAFNTWLGDTDSDWANTSNWGRGSVPGEWDNVGLYSFASNKPQLPAAGTVSCQNLILGAGAEISQASGTPPTINLSNNLIINGTWGIPTATVNLNGPGGAFWRQPYLTGTVDPLIINTLNLNYNYRIGVNLEVTELTLNTTANDVSLSVLEGKYVQVATQFDNDGGIFLDEGSSFILNDGATANCNTKWMLVAPGDNQQHALYMKDNSVLTIGSGAQFTVTGNATLQSGTTLTLESDATGTGSFKCTGSLTNNSGTMTAQRYIAGWSDATHGWHQLSSPVTTQAISPGFTDGTAANYDFYTWYEPEDIWVNFKNTAEPPVWNTANVLSGTSGEGNLIPGKGYLVAYVATDTKAFSGTFNNSNIPVTGLTKSDPAGTYNGWNFLGNPFPSALLWGTGDWNLNHVDDNCQIWNEQNAGYTVISSGNDIIPAMNGFMVHASADNASLTIPSSAKTHNAQAWYKSANEYNNGFTLLARDPEGSTAQESVVRFNPEATSGYDTRYDSYFLSGYAPQFYSVSNAENYALNTLPEQAESLVIPVGFVKNNSTHFSIELAENGMGIDVFLYDRITHITQKLNDGAYAFSSDEQDIPERFEIRFSPVGVDEVVSTPQPKVWYANNRLYVAGDVPSTQIAVYDLQGRLMVTRQLSTGEHSFMLSLPTGIYVVRINQQTSKIVITN